MGVIAFVLLVLALACFLLAACGIAARVNLVALGLAFLVAAMLFGGLPALA